MRSPESFLEDSTVRPIFFATFPLMKPRMLWSCQSVALAISAVVAPCLRRRSSRTIAFFVPARTSSLPVAGRAAFLLADFAFAFRFFGVAVFDAFLVAGLAVFFLADARFVWAAGLGPSVG